MEVPGFAAEEWPVDKGTDLWVAERLGRANPAELTPDEWPRIDEGRQRHEVLLVDGMQEGPRHGRARKARQTSGLRADERYPAPQDVRDCGQCGHAEFWHGASEGDFHEGACNFGNCSCDCRRWSYWRTENFQGHSCSNCGLAPVAVHLTRRRGREWFDLCARCRVSVYRNGRLPTRRATALHRRRLGLR